MPDFVKLPFVNTANKPSVITEGVLFARGIVWGESNTERGQAYRSQNIYIATLSNISVYLGCYRYTDDDYPNVTCRSVAISNNPHSCIIAPEVYNDFSTFNDNVRQNNVYCGEINTYQSTINTTLFNSLSELISAFISEYGLYPITYTLINCTVSAPTEAAVGDIVNADFTFPEGYGIVNNADVYVTNNGVVVPSTYANGRLTFTMPDPS